jgi:hypothetical protein
MKTLLLKESLKGFLQKLSLSTSSGDDGEIILKMGKFSERKIIKEIEEFCSCHHYTATPNNSGMFVTEGGEAIATITTVVIENNSIMITVNPFS